MKTILSILMLALLCGCDKPKRGDFWVYTPDDPFTKPWTNVVLEVANGYVQYAAWPDYSVNFTDKIRRFVSIRNKLEYPANLPVTNFHGVEIGVPIPQKNEWPKESRIYHIKELVGYQQSFDLDVDFVFSTNEARRVKIVVKWFDLHYWVPTAGHFTEEDVLSGDLDRYLDELIRTNRIAENAKAITNVESGDWMTNSFYTNRTEGK